MSHFIYTLFYYILLTYTEKNTCKTQRETISSQSTYTFYVYSLQQESTSRSIQAKSNNATQSTILRQTLLPQTSSLLLWPSTKKYRRFSRILNKDPCLRLSAVDRFSRQFVESQPRIDVILNLRHFYRLTLVEKANRAIRVIMVVASAT